MMSKILELLREFLSLILNRSGREARVVTKHDERFIDDVDQYTQLVPYEIPSIYMLRGERVMLPRRMAYATPDTKEAIIALNQAVHSEQGEFYLSDGFRSDEVQLRAHLDWKSGAKKAYSPPPGSSWHEAARAIDYEVKIMCKTINGGFLKFYDIASSIGWHFIIPTVDPNLSEAWHIEFRSDRFQELKNTIGYKQAVQAAIRDIGFHPDEDETDDVVEMIQEMLLALDYSVGLIDGIIGKRTSLSIMEFKRFYREGGTVTQLQKRLYKNITLLNL